MKEFEKRFPEPVHPKYETQITNYQRQMVIQDYRKEGWLAALECIYKKIPNNNKATFANQGQGMDGYSELANYRLIKSFIEGELNNE